MSKLVDRIAAVCLFQPADHPATQVPWVDAKACCASARQRLSSKENP